MALRCPKCNKKFKDNSRLKNHIINVQCNKVFACNMCGKDFKTNANLDRHINERITSCDEVNPVVSKTYICDRCENTYANKSNLYRHQKTCTKRTEKETLLETLREFREEFARFKDSYIKITVNNGPLVNSNINASETVNELNTIIERGNNVDRSDNIAIAIYLKGDNNYDEQLQKNKNIISEWVYFIKQQRTEPRIKIGLTKCLESRIKQFNTGNSDVLEIIAYIETRDMKTLEAQIHQAFVDYKLRGEWFEIQEIQLLQILENYRDLGELIVTNRSEDIESIPDDLIHLN